MNKFKLPHAKQSGFSLLELIVVIAIIALLSLGALVVYDGLTDKAQSTVSTANAAGLDTAIREYRSITLAYPDSWDNLAAATTTTSAPVAAGSLATITKTKFSSADITGAPVASIKAALTNAGINNLVQRADAATPGSIGVEPNDFFNSGVSGTTVTTVSNTSYVSILPTYGSGACSIGANALPTVYLDNSTATTASDGNRQNVINADLGATTCNLVLALGFGREAARSTNGKAINVTTAPLYTSSVINPAKNYARYIALFHVGQDGYTRPGATAGTAADNILQDGEIFQKAKLLTILDPEGKTIEENITAQNK